MLSWLARRLLAAVPVYWLACTVFFVLAHGIVDDPVSVFVDPELPLAQAQAAARAAGLDRPLIEQYVTWLARASVLDLGVSYRGGRPVNGAIAEALPWTLLLSGAALIATYAFGLLLALLASRRPGGWLDRCAAWGSIALYSIPLFWIALILMALAGRWLPGWPLGGDMSPQLRLDERASAWSVWCDRLRHLVLPVLTLVLAQAAGVLHLARARLQQALASDFVRAARARGVPERRILLGHALRNALLPIVTMLGLQLPSLVTGTVVVETLFAWPGMGSLMIVAVQNGDFPVLRGLGIVCTLAVILGSIAADALGRLVDPRVRDA